jgi:hypothetical protein
MIHDTDKAVILNAQFDATNIKFHDRAAAIASLTADGREVIYPEDGSAQVHYDGERLGLREALTRLAFDQRDLVDGRTLPREGAGTARPGTLSKSDMTMQEKLEYIKTNGADAYARIPSQNHDSKPLETQADWYKLSRKERVRRTAADPQVFTKLPPAPREASPVTKLEQIAPGTKINRSALEREKAIRGGR